VAQPILQPPPEYALIDQGATPELSKIWMPLDEFTVLAMDGLKGGDLHIPIGAVKQRYDKFEEGKVDVAKRCSTPRKT